MKIFMIFAATLALGGCVTAAQDATQPWPTNYRAIVAAELRQTFFDPYSVRDAMITGPMANSWYPQYVCVRANAKNRLGAYTGVSELMIVFRGGRIDHIFSEQVTTDYACAGAVYLPFREIEARSS